MLAFFVLKPINTPVQSPDLYQVDVTPFSLTIIIERNSLTEKWANALQRKDKKVGEKGEKGVTSILLTSAAEHRE